MALTKISNNSLSNISSLPASIPTGSLTLLSTQTASASASIEFTSGIDSTYDSYVFKFIDIHPSSTGALQFQGSTDGGSNYGITITSTMFRAYHKENDTETNLVYTNADLAQSTAFQDIYFNNNSPNNDTSNCGTIQIFNPSSTTYVKHFISTSNNEAGTNSTSTNYFTAGYFNTQSAIDAFKFQMNTGNIDDGIIKMYGVS